MELGECSTSIPPLPKRRRGNPFDGITPFASSTSPSLMKKGPCQVFINHRGCDTKLTLASTIYHTLDMINIHAFLDQEVLELGDSIPVEIQKAMDSAQLHIAILSEKYAESPWCLAELFYMLQTGTQIIPVFYHVDPSDLRWAAQGKGCYAPAFLRHEMEGRYDSNKLKDWKMALQRVSNLSGHVLKKNIGDEGMMLKSIVNSVLRVTKKEPLEVAKHPVGMDEIVKDFERTLATENKEGVHIVGIVGLGGSGKTTLATEVYSRKRSSINRSSFLHDVRDAASRNILHNQKKLLEDICNQTGSFNNVNEGKAIIKDRLKRVCVLIVLDDVDHEDQLDALLPPKESLERGSLVIITTREVDVLTKWGITSIYKAKPLQHLHAKQLFCWHAFLHPFPLQGFEDLVEKFLISCSGLPLSLKVIGGQLYGNRSKEYWDSQLKKIQRILPNEIGKRLKISYDALDEEEQEIFLDIACFFIGEKKSTAIEVWDGSGWSGLCSWEALQNKCLVESYKEHWGYKEERIRMHDHLRDLGRQIAKAKGRSPQRILFDKKTPFRGITESGDRRVKFELGWREEIESTEKCAELLRGVLWLDWSWFQGTSLPSWLPLDTIKLLEFSQPEFLETLWEDARPPLQLRDLRIKGAHRLQSLPRSIGHLQHLKRLYLDCNDSILSSDWDDSIPSSDWYASRLSSLPEEFCELKSLEHLVLRECDGLTSLPNRFGDLVSLRHLDLRDCKRLKRLPESFMQLIHLIYLDLDGCVSLESLDNIPNLKAVSFSDYGDHSGDDYGDHTSVGQLSLRFSSRYIYDLISIICQLSQLKELEIDGDESDIGSKGYKIEISQLSSLQNLKITDCENLHEISNLAELVSLTNVEVKECDSLKKIEGLEHLTSLENLVIWSPCAHEYSWPGLQTLNLWGLERLQTLNLRGLERLQTLNLRAEKISDFGDCIQNIEMENWPLEMTICGHSVSHDYQSILESFTFRGVDVHRMRDWSLTLHEKKLSNAAVVCYLLQCKVEYCDVRIGNRESTRTTLCRADLIVISVFKQVPCLLSLNVVSYEEVSYEEVKVLGEGVMDEKVEVLGGWVMVGARACILDGFKQLFQTLSNV